MPQRTGMRMCAAAFSLALIGVASAASAHVTVSSPDASAGGWGKLIFRVPTESETASTTSITVKLPAKTPFASVSTQVKPGWTAKIIETKHAKPVKVGDFNLSETASAVTWTSTGKGIPPGEFDEFSLSVGPIPEAKSLRFAAKQVYSDSSVVNWNQIQTGKTEPEHPTPTLKLTADDVKTARPEASTSNDDTSRGLAIGALVIAVAAALLALRNNRRHA